MDTVDIPLHSFTYRFRRLTWKEQAALTLSPKEDQRITVLAHALFEVSGLQITSPADARNVLMHIPPALRHRIWVVYLGKLPVDRKFSTKGLYDPPDQVKHSIRLIEEGDAAVDPQDAASAQMEQRFGSAEVREARELEQRMINQARQDGVLHVRKEPTDG